MLKFIIDTQLPPKLAKFLRDKGFSAIHTTYFPNGHLLDDKTPEQVYQHYKSRADIEILFDTFKNILFADTTYTRSNEAMEGWLFINHLALIFYYKLYKRLIQHKMLKKYSPKDILMHLNTIKKSKLMTFGKLLK